MCFGWFLDVEEKPRHGDKFIKETDSRPHNNSTYMLALKIIIRFNIFVLLFSPYTGK